MQGLRLHARQLLAATEEEERRLRARLASLQNEMGIVNETERSHYDTPGEHHDEDTRDQGQVSPSANLYLNGKK